MDSSVKTHFSIDYTAEEALDSASKKTNSKPQKEFLLFVEDYSFTDKANNLAEEEDGELERSQQMIKNLLHNTDEANKWEANTYEYRLNIAIFIESGIIYTLNYFFAGPFFIFAQTCFKWPLYHNLRLAGSKVEREVLRNAYIFPFVIFCTFYFEQLTILRVFIPVILLNSYLVLVTQASVLAYTNEKIPSLLKSIRLSEAEIKMVAKSLIYDAETELRNTINRLRIRASKLYFSFLEDKNEQFEDLKKQRLTEDENKECQKCVPLGGEVYYSEKVPEDQLLKTAIKFEKAIFQKKCFERETRFDKENLYGYNLACSLLAKTKQGRSQEWNFWLTLLGMAQALIVFSTSNFDGSLTELLKTGFAVFGMALVCFLILLFSIFHIIKVLNTSISNLKQRNELMDLMGKLVSHHNVQKRAKKGEEKDLGYPNMNIFDDMSLKTWISLRKIFMHYGDRQMETIALILTLFVGANVSGFIILALEYLGSYHIFNQYLLEMFKVSTCSFGLLGIFICRIMYLGASLNSKYRKHKELITKNRALVISLFRSYPNYIGEKPLKPESFFEVEGLRLLKREFGENYSKETLKERLEMLTETYDDILKEVDFEENHYPFKIMRVSITFRLIKTLATGVLSATVGYIIKHLSIK